MTEVEALRLAIAEQVKELVQLRRSYEHALRANSRLQAELASAKAHATPPPPPPDDDWMKAYHEMGAAKKRGTTRIPW